MPTISIRGNEMPASPIRKLAPLADAAKQRGVHVFHLNIGQPDLPTPQAAIDAIRNIDRKVLEYSPSAGYRSYREKLVGYYAKFNINLTADDIIITSGGSEAVLFSFLSCLNPGDEIIVPEPAYANYMAFAISSGASQEASAAICPINGGLKRAWQNFMTASRISLFLVINAPIRIPHSE